MPPQQDKLTVPPNDSEDPSCVDVDLMNRVKRGDRDAFSELYDRHSPHVYSLARKVLRCDADAEAVVSDVFFEMWRKPDRFDASRGNCRTYLMVLARSRSLDRLRKQSRRKEIGGGDNKNSLLEQSIDLAERPADAGPIQTEQQEQVHHAVAGLDRKQREPLMLAFFDGLTHQQIAEQLGQPLGTIKTRIRTGLQTLRSSLRTIGRHDDELP